MMTFKNIIIVVISILFLTILLQNTEVITLRLIFWNISMSRIIFLPMVLIIGFVLGYLTSEIRRKRKKSDISN